MPEIVVTQGLVELKLLGSRIEKAITQMNPVFLKIAGKLKQDLQRDETALKAKIESDVKSVEDLIKRRDAIKAAIVLSNSTAKVTIGGVEMTVAAAIEKKTSIEYEKKFLFRLEGCLATVIGTKNREEILMEDKLTRVLEATFGSKEQQKNAGEALVDTQTKFRDANKVEIFDPANIEKMILDLRKKIEDFESNVDVQLTISNSITKINIPD